MIAHLERKKKEVAAIGEAAEVAREQAMALLRLQRRVAEIDDLASGRAGGEASSGTDAVEERSGFQDSAQLQQQEQPRPPRQDAPPSRQGTGSALESCLSAEDRRRFGLDVEEVVSSPSLASPSSRSVAGAPTQSPAIQAQAGADTDVPPPRWSSLSAEDRKRFGLDDPAASVSSHPAAAPSGHAAVGSSASAVPRTGYIPPTGLAAPGQARAAAVQHHPEVLWGAENADGSMARTLAQLEAVGATRFLADLQESERQLQLVKMRG